MRNLIQRGDTWHFRGYVPKDLIHVVGKREIHRSLKTTAYTEAVSRRDAERIRHREWIEEAHRRHSRQFLVLTNLTDDQILDMAREVYAEQWSIAQERRQEFADDIRKTNSFATGGYDAMYEELRKGVVLGGDAFGIAADFTDELLERRLIDISQSPESRTRLQQRIAEVVAQVQIDLLDMITGQVGARMDPSLLNSESRLPHSPSFEIDGRPNTTAPKLSTLEALIEDFLKDVRLRRRDKGFVAIKASMRLAQLFFGPDTDARRIRRRECTQFRDFVMSLPSNYTKRYPKADVRDIPSLRKPEHTVMSYANVNKIIRHLMQFLGWCEEMEVIDRAPTSRNLLLIEPVSEKDKRNPFSREQLHQIFNSSTMKAEATNQSMFFWCYVIGLYHGLRLNEIAGLGREHITTLLDVPCIDVRIPHAVLDQNNPGGTKTVERVLPMHRVLIELGLPEFAASRKQGSKLFPEAKTGVDGYASRDVSDKTRQFLNTLGIPPKGPTFHSLRHCFRDAMTEAELSQEVMAFFGGWTLPGVMNQVYGSSKMHKSFKSHIDQISYGEIDDLILSLRPAPTT